MKTRVTIDHAGRITIPISVREELHLEPGGTVDIERCDDTILLRPVPDTPTLTKKHGVWVLHTGEPLPASTSDQVLQHTREECDLANLGNGE